MIQCPICQISNDEQSRFCAECGARLGAVNLPGAAPNPNNMPPGSFSGADPVGPKISALPPRAPSKKLRSPLLSSEEFEDETESPNAPGPAGRPAGLRSPILGSGNPAMRSESQPGFPPIPGQKAPSGKHHLHSPLLGDVDEDMYDAPEADSNPGRAGLHSPLLGGGGPRPGSGRQLRSPIFDGSKSSSSFEEYEEEGYDPYADEGNPNVLRSPLLSAKVPIEQAKPVPPPAKPLPPGPVPGFAHPSPLPVLPDNPNPLSSYIGQQVANLDLSVAPPNPINKPMAPPPPPPSPVAPPAPAPAPEISWTPTAQAAFEEQFPDMSQFRRKAEEQEQQQAQIRESAPAPAPIYEPVAQAPIPIYEAVQALRQEQQPIQAVPQPPQQLSYPVFEAPLPKHSPEPEVFNNTKPTLKRSTSKMFAEEPYVDESYADEPYANERAPVDFSKKAASSVPGPAANLPKIVGGLLIFLALIKAYAVMQYLPTEMGHYPPFLINEFSTLAAMLLIGCGFLLSRK